MSSTQKQIDSLRDDPTQTGLYTKLAPALRKDGDIATLAQLSELCAPHFGSPEARAEIWAKAAKLHLELDADADAERCLQSALELSPTLPFAAAALCSLLARTGRYAEAAAVVEAELAAAERAIASASNDSEETLHFDSSHLRERHMAAADIWGGNLGRLDKALQHYEAAWALGSGDLAPLHAARKIYSSLGDRKKVADLYADELKTLSEADARHADVELGLGRAMLAAGDVDTAITHLESAYQQASANREAVETLAEAYAAPGEDGRPRHQQRAAELFVGLGRERLGTEDHADAVNYLRRALGVDPYSTDGSHHLEAALTESQQWDDLDRFYTQQFAIADNDEQRRHILESQTELYSSLAPDQDRLKETLATLASAYPVGNEYERRLEALYRDGRDWDQLATLLAARAESLPDPQDRADVLLSLADIYSSQMGDHDRAAELLHQILSLVPGHEQAIAKYGEHFRARRDWRGLADLHEFAIDSLSESGVNAIEITRRLEDLAQVAELRLGDIDRAIHTWRRVAEIDPSSSRAMEAMRRLTNRAKTWQSLVGVLEQEAQDAPTPETKAEALRRIAHVYRERQVNPRQAIALYEEVLTLVPGDDAVLKALAELYDREGDDGGLALTLRRQLDLELHRMMDEAQTLHGDRNRGMVARDWPVAKRVERLTALRRLAAMYEDRLADVEGVVFACSGILEMLPGDRDALERMETVLEKAGDVARLEQTLDYHAVAATGPAERTRVLCRMAELAEQREDAMAAMERWEQVVKASPHHAVGLSRLADLYEHHSRWDELSVVLERALSRAETPPVGSPEAATLADKYRRYAQVVDQQLHDPSSAVTAWQKLLELQPMNRDAIEALVRLYEHAQRWRDLADALDRSASIYLSDSPERAVTCALQRAQLLEQRLGAPTEAIAALESLLRDVSPSNVEAHTSLRRLYESQGNFEMAVRAAEREMFLTHEPLQKIARGLDIGLLCRDRLGDPARALQAFERVLHLDPENQEALNAATAMYAAVGNWHAYIGALQQRIDRTDDIREQRLLLSQIAETTVTKLHEPTDGFAWYQKAHTLLPDTGTLGDLRSTAEGYGLWAELAAVYEEERQKFSPHRDLPGVAPSVDKHSFVATSREIAQLYEQRLGDPTRAIAALHDALKVHPEGEDLLVHAKSIASSADTKDLWHQYLACVDTCLPHADRPARVSLNRHCAEIQQQHLNAPEEAMTHLLRAFSWGPESEEIRGAIYELAETTKDWASALSVESALFQRATSKASGIEILRRKAKTYEDKLHDLPHAFREHLATFLISPDDDATTGHLWRLAKAIGTYEEADKVRPTPPPAAHIESYAPKAESPLVIESSRPVREQTQEISVSDLLEARTGEIDVMPAREDRTMQLDIADLMDVEPQNRRDPTMELRTEDLIDVLGGRAAPPTLPSAAQRRKRATGAPPQPPKKTPQITKRSRQPHPPRTKRPAAQGMLQVPQRQYETPWDELAAAFEVLERATSEEPQRWLYRAAEMWESGAENISRAFEMLARAIATAPTDSEARERLFRLAESHGQWDELARLLESTAELANSPRQAADLWNDVADIQTRQGRSKETEALYRKILGLCPDDAPTREKLEDLYRNQGRWIDLSAALEERTDPRLGSVAPEADRPALLRELAGLYSERLDRPHDAIEAMTRLRSLLSDDVEVATQLADLYTRIGRWSKVVEVLGSVANAHPGQPAAREALLRIGQIYETELELPDRAIDAYAALLSQWPEDPDALLALQRLYQSHAKWAELSAVLDRLAGLAKTDTERAAMLCNRATVMIDWLHAAEEAALVLRRALQLCPTDKHITDELVRALLQSDRAREAASMLERQVQEDAAGLSPGEMAAVYIRLAAVRADRLKDPHGAKTALEHALELVPDHPTALASLGSLAQAQRDPRAFADAKLREAAAHADVDAKIDALVLAGMTLRDECQDLQGARAALSQVLELRPFHANATWALAGIVEQAGDSDEAVRLLESRIEVAGIAPKEKAEALTQLAALARHTGTPSRVQDRLSQALEILPDHLPAIFSQCDLYMEQEGFGALIRFLEQRLPTLEEFPKEVQAELRRRLALAHEAAGNADEAYQTLLAADKLQRRNLRVKLSLGENRYRARRWREAALHLGSIADHPDASRHPKEVASGLYHAALAEIRSLRPERAEALYERAIHYKPNYTPALSALAEIAMERGDVTRAADLLTRQATATDDPAERLGLFEALGDLVLQSLGDPERGKLCYASAVSAASPLEASHLPLLNKLLKLQDDAQNHGDAARTAELMASFSTDDADRAVQLRIAASNYASAGDTKRARAAAERAVEAAPYDITAVAVASEILMEEGEFDATAKMLGRALSGGDQPDEATAARHSRLWYRLGKSRLERGDERGAVEPLMRSVEVASDSDGAMMARRTLVKLWTEDKEHADKRREYLQILATDTLTPADIAAYARELATREHIDAARVLLDLAGATGHEFSKDDVAFLGTHPTTQLAEDESYAGVLTAKYRANTITDALEDEGCRIAEAVWQAAPMLWPDTNQALAQAGYPEAERLSATSSHGAAMMYTHIARALDAPATSLFASFKPDAPDLNILCTSPPVIVFGPRILEHGDEAPSDLELRFMLGRAAELVRPQRILASGLSEARGAELFASLDRIFRLANETADDAELRTALPVKVRTKLKKLAQDHAPDYAAYRAACDRAADRAGLLICGDIDTALRLAREARPPSPTADRHLQQLALRPDYLKARTRLGVAITK